MAMSTLQTANPAMVPSPAVRRRTAVPAQVATVPFRRLSRKGQILGPQQRCFAFGSL